MRMKTLLLGSAAALGVSGVAQAADLSFAVAPEPVDYVRVCDAFGTGYYYIPGTDTCLKISGYVRVEARFYSDDQEVADDHDDSYKFFTRGALTVEARSQTDWGPLVAIINLEADFDDPTDESNGNAVGTNDVLLSLGPLYAGYTQSLFDQVGGGYAFIGLDGAGNSGITDNKLNAIGLNWNFGGIGVAIALEDNRYRADYFFDDASDAGDFPDLVAALMGEWGNIGAAVSFLYMDTSPNSVWGVQGYVEASDVGIYDMLVGASYLDAGSADDVFSILAGLRANWTSNLTSSINFRNDNCGGGWCTDTWAVDFDTRFYPVENMLIAAGVQYDDASDSYEARIRLQRDFGD